jgi:hypothetical protein
MYLRLILINVFIILYFIICSALFAQKPYLTIGGGYQLGHGKMNLGETYTSSNGIGSVQRVKGSYGEGFHIGGSLGYNINKNLAVEAAVNLIDGRSFETSFYSSHSNGLGIIISNKYELESRTEFVQFIPSLMLRIGWSKFDPYAKVGLILGTGTIFYSFREQDTYEDIESYYELSKGLGLGYKTSIGTFYHFNDWFSLFAELSVLNNTFSPNRGRLTSYKENGIEMIDGMSVNEREVEYQEEYDFNYNDNHDENVASKEIKQSFPLGSAGLQIGIRFQLK